MICILFLIRFMISDKGVMNQITTELEVPIDIQLHHHQLTIRTTKSGNNSKMKYPRHESSSNRKGTKFRGRFDFCWHPSIQRKHQGAIDLITNLYAVICAYLSNFQTISYESQS